MNFFLNVYYFLRVFGQTDGALALRLKQDSFLNNDKFAFLYPFNYCIGHGLFFTKEIFDVWF